MEKGTISVSFVAEALEALRGKEIAKQELLQRSNISPALLAYPDARVSSAIYAALMRNLAELLDDEFLGHDSRRIKVGSFAMLCHCVIACSTLRAALERALRFYALLLDDLRGQLVPEGDLTALVLSARQGTNPSIFAQEMLLMFLHRLACWLTNRRIPIRSAFFRYAPPAHADEYQMMFGRDIRFGEPQTCIIFDTSFLALPIRRSETALEEFLAIAPEGLLLRYRDSKSATTTIIARLGQYHPTAWPSFGTLAKSLGSSETTLRRRLEEEGNSYQLIKDQLRRDMAINLLSDTHRNVTDIGAQIGFAEASAFHRAFKKWTGATPGDYRRKHTN